MPRKIFPPRVSDAEIEVYALKLRRVLNIGDELPILDLLTPVENDLGKVLPGFSLDIVMKEEMPETDADAYTKFLPPTIILREDIYEGVFRREHRSRFTLAHELGHLTLHWGLPRARLAPKSDIRIASSDAEKAKKKGMSAEEERIENEAHRFAGALLMPRGIVIQCQKDPYWLSTRCNVSLDAASKRIHTVLHDGDEFDAQGIQRLFGPSRAAEDLTQKPKSS